MTISEFKLKSKDEEPVRRLEIFTGSGRRREWRPEEKARIVAESYEAGETVVLWHAGMDFPRSNCSPGVGLLAGRWGRQRYRNPCSCRRW